MREYMLKISEIIPLSNATLKVVFENVRDVLTHRIISWIKKKTLE